MMEYRIAREDLLQWCRIQVNDLPTHPDRKCEMTLYDTRKEVAEYVGNLMAEEMIANNKAGKPTKWVLPSGPEDQYRTFLKRVNEERISLNRLYVFHMDEILDWETRPYPLANSYESCEGRMLARFYGKIDPELNVPEENRIWPRVSDLDRPDRLCDELGGIDTVWAGVGYKGLVAANEAPDSLYQRLTVPQYAKSKTRVTRKTVDAIVMKSERSFGGLYDLCDPFMVTLGFKVMLSAKRCVAMITTGAWKQTAIRVAMFAEPTLEYPFTLFPKYVPEVILACDRFTADHPLTKKEIVLSAENTGAKP